jgi:quinol monooxygenase YgiN
MDHLEFTATFPSIPAGRLDEFKELGREMIERTRTEPGCRRYDWFFGVDGTVCEVKEAYDDSDAVMAHAANVGELAQKAAEIGGGLQVQAYGELSPELADMLSAVEPTRFSFFGGS